MKQIVKRPELDNGRMWLLVQIGWALLAYQHIRNFARQHPAPAISLAVGMLCIFPAWKLNYMGEWLAISAFFLVLFIVKDIVEHKPAQAHWDRPTKPGDTGPLHPR